MNQKFLDKALALREKNMTPELEKLEKDLCKWIDQTTVAYGAFIFDGSGITMMPPESPDIAYFLVALQVINLSKAYEKNQTVIMAEINCMIKELMKCNCLKI